MTNVAILLALALAQLPSSTGSAPPDREQSVGDPPPRPLNHMLPAWMDQDLKQQAEAAEQARKIAETEEQRLVAQGLGAAIGTTSDRHKSDLIKEVATLHSLELELETRITQLQARLLRSKGGLAPWDSAFAAHTLTALNSTYIEIKFWRLACETELRK